MPLLHQGMQEALEEAQASSARNEVPIGAALFFKEKLIAKMGNTCFAEDNPFKHAEILVLNQALSLLSQADFRQATLFVTLEPCPMCMGAILHSHLGCLVFGAYNLKWGSCGTVLSLQEAFPSESLKIYGGICEQECTLLLEAFFSKLRKNS